MYCTKCGNPIPDGSSFCTKCGTPALNAKTASTSNAATPAFGAPIQNAYGATAPAFGANDQNAYGAAAPAYGATAPQPPVLRKKRSPIKGIVIGLLIVALAAGGATLAILQPWNATSSTGSKSSVGSDNSETADKAASGTASSAASSAPSAESSSQSANSASGSQQGSASQEPSGSSASSSSAPSPSNESSSDTGSRTTIAPRFTRATASSVSKADNIDTYTPSMVLDGNTTTAWNSDGEQSNTGVGQWIELASSTKQHVSGIRILPGYCKNETVWSKNRRPHEITISFSDGSSIKATLNDEFGAYQTITFARPVDTTTLRVTINSTYSPTATSGRTYNDCCISEIEAF